MTAYVLLLPLLLPAVSAFAARKKADPKLLTGLMVLELALVLLGCLIIMVRNPEIILRDRGDNSRKKTPSLKPSFLIRIGVASMLD